MSEHKRHERCQRSEENVDVGTGLGSDRAPSSWAPLGAGLTPRASFLSYRDRASKVSVPAGPSENKISHSAPHRVVPERTRLSSPRCSSAGWLRPC